MSTAPENASTTSAVPRPAVAGPPTKHQLALMIWIAVFPTLTVLNLTIGPLLAAQHPVLRTFILATIAVPIVIYGLMPHLTGSADCSSRAGQPDPELHGRPTVSGRP